MEEEQRRLFDDDADGETSLSHVREASPDELEERHRAQQLPIDQQALNIVGLASATRAPQCRNCEQRIEVGNFELALLLAAQALDALAAR